MVMMYFPLSKYDRTRKIVRCREIATLRRLQIKPQIRGGGWVKKPRGTSYNFEKKMKQFTLRSFSKIIPHQGCL